MQLVNSCSDGLGWHLLAPANCCSYGPRWPVADEAAGEEYGLATAFVGGPLHPRGLLQEEAPRRAGLCQLYPLANLLSRCVPY